MTAPDGVVLVGHGGVPTDCPRELVQRLKALEAHRRAGGGETGDEERSLDARIRHWPRTPATDPYGAGLEAVAEALRPQLGGAELVVAFNEFCAPTVAEAVDALVARGRRRIVVVPSMLTPGGVSEVEIPEALARLRVRHPGVELRYAWPFDVRSVARLTMPGEDTCGGLERVFRTVLAGDADAALADCRRSVEVGGAPGR